MIKVQKRYCDYLEDIKALLNDVGLSDARLEALKERIANAELLVPVIGAFSAGKSTLINSFLGNSFLPVDITPETALATELHFGEDERIEAVDADQGMDIYPLDSMAALKIKAAQYRYIRVYLKNEQLKNIHPLVLVDMPGFDSPLDLHNQAILQYISKGAHYMVLTSVEEGGLTRSMIRQIAEVYDVNKGISFFLSKANLRAPSEAREISKKISSQLEDQFSAPHAVIPVGLSGGADLQSVIGIIDPEKLMGNLFKDLVLDVYSSCKGEINTRVSALKKSKKENDDALCEIKQGLANLLSKKKSMLEEAREKYAGVRVSRVVERVGQELSNSIDELIAAASSSGSDAFGQAVSEIVRSTLLHEIRVSMEELNTQIIRDFSVELKSLDGVLTSYENGDVAWLDRAVSSTDRLLHSGVDKLGQLGEGLGSKGGMIYKTLATIIGITTSIVAPIVELVIIFLPEIISFLTVKSREQQQREKIRASILTGTIPSVKGKLRAELPEIFNQHVQALIREISEQFEEKIKEQQLAIQSVQSDKEEKTKVIEGQVLAYLTVIDQMAKRTTPILNG